MKVKISYLLCAGRVIQDQNTGKFTYIDIFDHIIIPPETPLLFQQFYVAGELRNIKSGLHQVEVKVVDPDNKIIASVPFEKKNLMAGTAPFAAFFSLVKIEKDGKHSIKVFFDGNELESDSFFVVNHSIPTKIFTQTI